MQTLIIKIDDDYVGKIINFLRKIPNNKVEITKKKEKEDSNVFGLLKGHIGDPVEWQQKLRAENGR